MNISIENLHKNTKKILFLNKADNTNLVEKADKIINYISKYSKFDIAITGSLKEKIQIYKSCDLKRAV